MPAHEKDWYQNKDQWLQLVDKYLPHLNTAKSFRELAEEMEQEPSWVRKVLKRMEKEGYLRSYKVGNMGKIVYIRKIGNKDWKDWLE